ncbi:RlpA-like double-psi beta-barrel-protein domain-containing protein-containing protein [Bombardia bombarda]|uniref:RlpA-like double-psi beta-barrel-protein domain-containing protein-containing protein n=1 Tax=Bombardia bombarda TaxID=252184 RepID=A0AA39XNP2_9PEZI|nr:RlpA-like double-psi beta-barrel-protein domain-containing protein-containing protein [Bombardia bombarda]
MPITNTTINHGHDQAKKRKAAGTRTGDMTYYTVGMGACGHDDSGKGDSEYIVAVSESLDTDSCGQTVTIQGSNGNSVQGVVRDKCPSCAEGALDVSEKTFKDLIGDLDVGVAQVTWSFN